MSESGGRRIEKYCLDLSAFVSKGKRSGGTGKMYLKIILHISVKILEKVVCRLKTWVGGAFAKWPKHKFGYLQSLLFGVPAGSFRYS